VTGSFVSPQLRDRVRGLATPIATGLGRLGLSPNALTIIGFLGTCAAAVAAAYQAWLVAGILVLAFGIFDLFDGTLARAIGQATRFGAFLDSTLDRWGESVVYVGIAWGCVDAGFANGAVLAGAAMASAFMVSYTRAKSESLGFTTGTRMAAIGLAPREVRLGILTLGLLAVGLVGGVIPQPVLTCAASVGAACPSIGFLRDGPGILGPTLGLITILATITTIQRILHVRAQAKEG
jgi:CDP-diacylglycerol--glycerol-3-phosphate 3-phosphatidyltransferase